MLGSFGFYSRFIPSFSSVVEPFRAMLRSKEFSWTKECEDRFLELKSLLLGSPALASFDGSLPVIVSTDASNSGLGAVLFVEDPVLGRHVVEFASRTLSETERRYSVTEKEALALVWSVERWRHYLLGRSFVLEVDHEPLKMLFSAKGVDRMSLRLARWSTRLMMFKFELRYKKGSLHVLPDYLSRFPVSSDDLVFHVTDDSDLFVNQIASLASVSISEFRAETERDEVLSAVSESVGKGWKFSKEHYSDKLRPFFQLRNELSLVSGVLFRGERFVVPSSLREKIFELAHEGHLGIVRTKAKIRETFWWPGLDSHVENSVRNCSVCQEADKSAKFFSSLPPVKVPKGTECWHKLSVDIKGPMYANPRDCRFAIVLVDVFSRWPEVKFVPDVTSSKIIEFLEEIFSREGFCDVLLSDNGSVFTSSEFEDYLSSRGIKHELSPIYYPQYNPVERFNGTLKNFIQTSVLEKKPLKSALQSFLFSYRSSVHPSTGLSPFVLLRNRVMKSKLFLPSKSILKSKQNRSPRKVVRFQNPFAVGESVRVKHPRLKKIVSGLHVTHVLGSRTVRLSNGQKWSVFHLSKDYSPTSRSSDSDDELSLFDFDLPASTSSPNPTPPGTPDVGLREMNRGEGSDAVLPVVPPPASTPRPGNSKTPTAATPTRLPRSRRARKQRKRSDFVYF